MANNASSGQALTHRRTPPERRVVTMAPSPWRRRKRLRLATFLGSMTDVFMVLVFTGLMVFACFEAQGREKPKVKKAFRAQVRPGGAATAIPAQH
jgi:hypothetical protein